MTRAGTPSWRSRAPRRDAALAAPDDHHVGLLVSDPERGVLGLPLLQPGHPVLVRAVLGTHRASYALGLLVALELVQGGEEGPRLRAVLVDEPEQAATAADRGLERRTTRWSRRRRSAAGSLSRKPDGSTRSRVAARRSATPSGSSTVVRFQEKATRSRQKLVAANRPAARSMSRAGEGGLEVREPGRGGVRCRGGVGRGDGPVVESWVMPRSTLAVTRRRRNRCTSLHVAPVTWATTYRRSRRWTPDDSDRRESRRERPAAPRP